MTPGAGAGAAFAWLGQALQPLSGRDWACLLAALALIRASSRLGMWAYALMALPGTFAHELAHYLTALLLRAQPSFPSLRPQRTAHGWRLGSVAFRAGALRSVPIALAPFALAPLALAWAIWWMVPASGALYVAHAWVVAALLSASLPSSADFRIALPALLVLALALAAAWLAWH
jgi:hypothetical protein